MRVDPNPGNASPLSKHVCEGVNCSLLIEISLCRVVDFDHSDIGANDERVLCLVKGNCCDFFLIELPLLDELALHPEVILRKNTGF